MDHPNDMAMRRWSTADVDPSQALDYYAAAVEKALLPFSVQCPSRAHFHASVESTNFGCLDVLRLVGSPHQVSRGASELARSDRRVYHLMVNRLAPWRLTHQGRTELRPGDAILTDSALPHELEVGAYELINISMPAAFIEQWIPNPSMLTARRLDRDGQWTATLAGLIAQLSPEFALNGCPLPDEVVMNQLGVLLMLAAKAVGSKASRVSLGEFAMRDQIEAFLRERLSDPDMRAAAVAQFMGASERKVHDILAAHGETFASLLLRMRVKEARRLQALPSSRRMSPDDVARAAGFKDTTRMAGAVRSFGGMNTKHR